MNIINKNEFSVKYRSILNNRDQIPLLARSVGDYRINSLQWRDNPLKKNFVQLFWGIKGNGEFVVDDTKICLKPENVFAYFPGDVHVIRPLKLPWHYKWITFEGSMAFEITKGFGIMKRTKKAGKCPEELFIQLEQEICKIGEADQRKAGAIVYQILSAVHEQASLSKAKDIIIENCVKLIEKNYSKQDLNVNFLADSLKFHRTSLCKLLKKKTGMTPVQYILSVRMGHGIKLLKSTQLSIDEISKKIGYCNPNYFANVFKKTLGTPPSKFRK